MEEEWTAEDFDAWVRSKRWQYAKTMPQVPHEYVLWQWGGAEHRKAWDRAAAYVKAHGRRARGPNSKGGTYRNTYLLHGDYLYWRIGWGALNRCFYNPPVPANRVQWIDDPPDDEPLPGLGEGQD